ncbi:permease prefix domain 1-containing protein [Agromyces italicus]|uniref:permease prefix domain 1-containing protein n=1 Tax=Agromyces italicus TaxID=279572 RepID=UPI0003B53379|nr:permease prefix domain 1-containing protein [Agromyces italicus]
MNVITAYLETMFGAYSPTARLLEAKAELHTMMEDAYHGYVDQGLSENEAVGRVITEFGNLDELAPQLGISAEIAPAAGGPGVAAGATMPSAPHARAAAPAPVTQEEAEAFAEARRRSEPRVALAVALLVMSPMPLIALATLTGGGAIALDQQVGVMIGLGALLAIVTVAVMMMVRRGQLLEPFARLTAGEFTRSPGVDRWARQLAAEASPRRTTALQIAIGLWILAVTPVLAMSLLAPPEVTQAWIGVAVAAMLAIVATGLLVFLPSNWAASVAETLTQAEGVAAASDDRRGIVGVISAFYWPLVVVVFLGWSFIGGDWGRSWIVWPIAAVLFAAISSGLHAVERYRANRAG